MNSLHCIASESLLRPWHCLQRLAFFFFFVNHFLNLSFFFSRILFFVVHSPPPPNVARGCQISPAAIGDHRKNGFTLGISHYIWWGFSRGNYPKFKSSINVHAVAKAMRAKCFNYYIGRYYKAVQCYGSTLQKRNYTMFIILSSVFEYVGTWDKPQVQTSFSQFFFLIVLSSFLQINSFLLDPCMHRDNHFWSGYWSMRLVIFLLQCSRPYQS